MEEIPDPRHVLIVDDNQHIHEDFRKVLGAEHDKNEALEASEKALFGGGQDVPDFARFSLESAFQGHEALDLVCTRVAEGKPFSVAFVDVRMPPGWDGIETIAKLWEEDPLIQIVVCTAYSDYTLDDIHECLGHTDRFIILKKPFDNIEVRQLARSLSQKWYLEQKIRRYTEELEDQVKRRTRALYKLTEQLKAENLRATYLARKADDARQMQSQFLGMMGHEILTPMNGFIGMTELLLKSTLTEEQRDYADTAMQCGEQLLELLNKLLDYSNLDTGLSPGKVEAFDISESINGILSPFADQSKLKNVVLSTYLAQEVPKKVNLDQERFQRVLSNLTSNAVKFTEAGEVKISVELQDGRVGKPELLVSVEDTGIGISDDDQTELFGPFCQVDSSSTRKFGGVGLGLAISEKLVKSMGGSIGFESKQGKGSRFWFTLPLAEPDESAEAIKRLSQPGSHQQPEDFEGDQDRISEERSFSALVVDDNIVNGKVLATLLKNYGMEVDLAMEGEQAIAKWKDGSYAIIFMDCHMPGMDGFEVTKEIRAQESRHKLKPTPVIAYTASVRPKDWKSCFEAGMNGFLGKPLKKTELSKLLEEQLSSTCSN